MPEQSNELTIRVLPNDGSDAVVFAGVNYLSWISSPGGQGQGTFGIPAIISDPERKREGLPLRVLYVNPANVAAVDATRNS